MLYKYVDTFNQTNQEAETVSKFDFFSVKILMFIAIVYTA